jgi:hypothetical protein
MNKYVSAAPNGGESDIFRVSRADPSASPFPTALSGQTSGAQTPCLQMILTEPFRSLPVPYVLLLLRNIYPVAMRAL